MIRRKIAPIRASRLNVQPLAAQPPAPLLSPTSPVTPPSLLPTVPPPLEPNLVAIDAAPTVPPPGELHLVTIEAAKLANVLWPAHSPDADPAGLVTIDVSKMLDLIWDPVGPDGSTGADLDSSAPMDMDSSPQPYPTIPCPQAVPRAVRSPPSKKARLRRSGSFSSSSSRSPSPSPEVPVWAKPVEKIWNKPPRNKRRLSAEKRGQVKADFDKYLETHGQDIIAQYVKEISVDVNINFLTLRQNNQELAYVICNQFERKLKSQLTRALRNFLSAQFASNDNLRVQFAETYQCQAGEAEEILKRRIYDTRLHFEQMPECVQSLTEFLDLHKSVTRNFFDGHSRHQREVTDADAGGRCALQKAIKHVYTANANYLSWNGEWSLSDWDVNNNGEEVVNTKMYFNLPENSWMEARRYLHNDLKRIASEIIPKLTKIRVQQQNNIPDSASSPSSDSKPQQNNSPNSDLKQDPEPLKPDQMPEHEQSVEPPKTPPGPVVDLLYPPYMLHLSRELMNPIKLSAEEHYGWYHDYVCYHPALLSCRARMNLIFGFYHIAFSLEYQKNFAYGGLYGNTSYFPSWTHSFYAPRHDCHDFLWDTFWYKVKFDRTSPPSSWPKPYQNTAGDLLKFVRHLFEHIFRYSKEAMTVGTDQFLFQTIKSDDDVDLFVSCSVPSFLPDFIKLIFLLKKMQEPEFLKNWNVYVAAANV